MACETPVEPNTKTNSGLQPNPSEPIQSSYADSKPFPFNRDTSELHILDSLGFAYNCIFDPSDHFLTLKFYKRTLGKWVFDYRIDSIRSQMGDDSLQIMDYNFDGIPDARLSCGTGGRGANEFFEVFIRNPKTKKFKRLITLNNPPNLTPNPKTKKVEATRFYGKTIVEEYRIENDTLRFEREWEIDLAKW